MHRLLKRQLKRFDIGLETREQIAPFLEAINQAYYSNDSDIRHLEKIIEESSQELYKANKLLSEDLNLKNSEIAVMNRRYDLVVNNIKEILFILDGKGILTYTNKAYSFLAPNSKNSAIGKPVISLKHFFTEDSSYVFDELNDNAKPKVHGVIERYNDKGDHRWYELKATRIKNDLGVIEGTIGIVSDITDSVVKESELIDSRESAEMASRAKDEFLSTMSHEIRTPLNAIVGISNILMMQNKDDQNKENLEALEYSSDHLLHLINDILDFSKIEAGKIDILQEDISLNKLISGIKTTYQYNTKEKGIELKITKDNSLPTLIKGDITRLSQVIGNLVSNAIKFTTEGDVQLVLTKKSIDKNRVTVLVEIIDSGIGIKEDQIDRIFDKFSQASKNTTKLYGGTGLGLPISKKLLELMGSQLQVESTYGEGSKFYFEIDFDISENEKVSNAKNNSVDFTKDLKGLKILVAEDNKLNIMVIKQYLKKWNTQFSIVMNGQEALDLVKREKFDFNTYGSSNANNGWIYRHERNQKTEIIKSGHSDIGSHGINNYQGQ